MSRISTARGSRRWWQKREAPEGKRMTSGDLIGHLARFAGVLRGHGIEVGVGDEIDATQALTLVDLFDRAEVRRAFQIALKIRPRDRAVFDPLFDWFWSEPAGARNRDLPPTGGNPDLPAEAGSQTISRDWRFMNRDRLQSRITNHESRMSDDPS